MFSCSGDRCANVAASALGCGQSGKTLSEHSKMLSINVSQVQTNHYLSVSVCGVHRDIWRSPTSTAGSTTTSRAPPSCFTHIPRTPSHRCCHRKTFLEQQKVSTILSQEGVPVFVPAPRSNAVWGTASGNTALYCQLSKCP